ncbi:hypothetical protein MettiDRAFT_0982 [Methanolobus tindarius DSM 2278]|uniref:Uncharacterized protein n=1 Tax=Methanolobus tindarius DSM 2278 TaxID=1090322 RepID=W9DQG1_METTI|nr:hypothetical protein [Methanolobus tindarius]ETA67555.1 hypothetical protein MettiDRAFT_0982 [Methanolobus tindarius DSM 2278]
MEWEIQFQYDKNLDQVFIHKLFYFLVSRGVKYNACSRYKAYYLILTDKPENDIGHDEEERKESTEKLAEIIETYSKFDLKTTSFSIWLDYLNEVNFRFGIDILQVKDNDSFISLKAGEHLVPDENTFLVFMDLCKELFVRFNLSHGAFRNEYEDSVPSNKKDFLKEKPNIVSFYSKPFVDQIGRDILLSSPAFKVEELENGGVMLIVCTDVLWCSDEMDRVREHLGY